MTTACRFFFQSAIPFTSELYDLSFELALDPFTNAIMQDLQKDLSSRPKFHLANQKLFYYHKVVIPYTSQLRLKLLAEAHSTAIRGHGDFLKTFKCLSKNFYWPVMKEDVKAYMRHCATCQQNKYKTLAPVGLLQPLPLPSHI